MSHKRVLHRRLSKKNQVAIPVVFLRECKILPESEVIIEKKDDGILIKQGEDPIDAAFGMFAGPDTEGREISLEYKEESRREDRERNKRKFGIDFM